MGKIHCLSGLHLVPPEKALGIIVYIYQYNLPYLSFMPLLAVILQSQFHGKGKKSAWDAWKAL